MDKLPIGQTFRIANRIFFDNWEVFSLLAVVAAGVSSLFSSSSEPGTGASAGSIVLETALFLALTLPATIAAFAATDQACRGERAQLMKAVRVSGVRYWAAFLTLLLSSICVGLGFILLIIPGVIAYAMLFVAVPASVLESSAPVASLKRSARLTKGNIGPVLCVGIVPYLVIGAGLYLVDDASTVARLVSAAGSGLITIYEAILSVVVYWFLTTTTASSASAPSG